MRRVSGAALPNRRICSRVVGPVGFLGAGADAAGGLGFLTLGLAAGKVGGLAGALVGGLGVLAVVGFERVVPAAVDTAIKPLATLKLFFNISLSRPALMEC